MSCGSTTCLQVERESGTEGREGVRELKKKKVVCDGQSSSKQASSKENEKKRSIGFFQLLGSTLSAGFFKFETRTCTRRCRHNTSRSTGSGVKERGVTEKRGNGEQTKEGRRFFFFFFFQCLIAIRLSLPLSQALFALSLALLLT